MIGFSRRCLAALVAIAVSVPVAAQSAPPVVPRVPSTNDQLASRFLAQATFGPTSEAIAELAALNYDYAAWIQQEIAKPPTYTVPLLTAGVAAGAINAGIFAHENRFARNEVMLRGSDQLRQRVAYSLSQIFVISDQAPVVFAAADGSSDYYDMLVRNAFGNFRTLLYDVARHPQMGRYLSHYRNRLGDPITGRRPDENFAREIMQLFSIGLYELEPNGRIRLNAEGRPIETYTNAQITEFARVFTGFTDEDNNPNAVGSWPNGTNFPLINRPNNKQPMKMWEPQHDRGAKTLLQYPGATKPVLPANQTGLQDFEDAIANLFEHPNTPPFIARLLIQRLVTSNPTEGYVRAVADAFRDNGQGARGDLRAVVTAILMHPEARDPARVLDPEHGKLREPFLRLSHFLRALNFTVTFPNLLPYRFSVQFNENSLGHYPLSSPSVFNFYLPDYQPPGPLANAGLYGPEFQIHNAVYAIATPNVFSGLLANTYVNIAINVAPFEALASSPAALLDEIDELLTHGTMSAATRQSIITAVQQVVPPTWAPNTPVAPTRARLALFLAMLSPDYAIQK
jgi:uncharacterized protein (DUF1800 family)